jgi:hypothetical protein
LVQLKKWGPEVLILSHQDPTGPADKLDVVRGGTLVAQKLGLCLLCLVILNACNRGGNQSSQLSFSVPSSSQALAADNYLNTAIVNVHVPGQAVIVQQYDAQQLGANIASGQPLNFSVPNLPVTTGVIVQFIGVYQSDSQGTQTIEFGDTTLDLIPGNVTANISATALNVATHQGRVQGRYITAGTNYADATGPTGTLVTYFQPPDGTPAMAVNEDYIYNGWFNIFVIDSPTASLSYVVQETGQTIFSNINLMNNPFAPSTYLIHMVKPINYLRDGSADIATDYFQGFFISPSLNGFDTTSLLACYPNYKESLPGLIADPGGLHQLDYQPQLYASTSVFSLTQSAGYAAAFTDQYFSSAGCLWDSGATNFYPEHIVSDGDDSGAFGVNGPFRLVNPFDHFGSGFLTSVYDPSANQTNLSWAYLPGAIQPNAGQITAVDGSTVYANYASTGLSFNSDTTCDQTLSAAGYVPLADVSGTSGSPTSFTFTSGTAVQGQTLNAGNFSNFSYALCPFHLVNGQKVYFASGIQSNCSGLGCSLSSVEPYGWSDGTTGSGEGYVAPISAPILSTAAPLYGFSALVNSVVANSPVDQFPSTTITLQGSTNGFSVNDEVMIHIVAAGHPTDCQASAAFPVLIGEVAYARVLSVSGQQITIPGDTFANTLPGSTILKNAPTPNSTFCTVQAVRVLQFQDLTIETGGSLTPPPFSYTYTGGGVLAIRVSGTLTLSGNGTVLNAGGQGFAGGGNLSNGAGSGGTTSSYTLSLPYSNAGHGNVLEAGGGGAGFGAGGSGSGASGGFGIANEIPFAALFGGGGGSGSSLYGGNGGGAIMVAARNLAVGASDVNFDASGGVGAHSGNLYSAGAGGGGQVGVIVDNFSSAGGVLSLSADGGPTANGLTNGNSGTGGGGVTASVVCLSSNGTININSVTGGANSNTAHQPPSSYDGLAGYAQAIAATQTNLCPNNGN